MDVLAAASTKSNTNVSLLGESFKYVAPLCGTLGYSAEDAAVSLGLMANAGIKGSQAGTTLRTSITNLVYLIHKRAHRPAPRPDKSRSWHGGGSWSRDRRCSCV